MYIIIFLILIIIFFFIFDKKESKRKDYSENFGAPIKRFYDDTLRYTDIYTPIKYTYPMWYNKITPFVFNNPTRFNYYNYFYPRLHRYHYPYSVLY